MKKRILRIRRSLLPTLLALVLITVIASTGTASPIPVIAQTYPTTTVYLNPPTINGTVIDEEFNVSIMISDAQNVFAWQAGLIFNAAALECLNFTEGEFLRDEAGPEGTFWVTGNINNTIGAVWRPYSCYMLGEYLASGSERLAYATFKVKATGVSDIHLSDVTVLDLDLNMIPTKIIDVYSRAPHTVVTVSNLTGRALGAYGCGFYDHFFDASAERIGFKVAGPSIITDASGIHDVYGSFADVTIPTGLLKPENESYAWGVIIDGSLISVEERTITENATHTSIYFLCTPGFHEVQISPRFLISNISIALSSRSVAKGESIRISGAIDPLQVDANVTIQYRKKGAVSWDTLATNRTTDTNSRYEYTWETEETGTFEVRARWDGDVSNEILGAISRPEAAEVKGKQGIPLEIVAVVVVVIIIVVAIVVYFVKFRKPKT